NAATFPGRGDTGGGGAWRSGSAYRQGAERTAEGRGSAVRSTGVRGNTGADPSRGRADRRGQEGGPPQCAPGADQPTAGGAGPGRQAGSAAQGGRSLYVR